MVAKNIRGTRAYRTATRRLKAEGDAPCWSCGKQLYADAPWPHPLTITLGHYIAVEDGGDPYSRDNHDAQCITCNMGDGARRTNNKKQQQQQQGPVTRVSWRSDNY